MQRFCRLCGKIFSRAPSPAAAPSGTYAAGKAVARSGRDNKPGAFYTLWFKAGSAAEKTGQFLRGHPRLMTGECYEERGFAEQLSGKLKQTGQITPEHPGPPAAGATESRRIKNEPLITPAPANLAL